MKPEIAFNSLESPLPPVPWQNHANLLTTILTSATVESFANETGDWLVNAVGSPGGDETLLAWLHRPREDGWNELERGAWMVASQSLVRWYSQANGAAAERRAIERRLEQAAAVTGRLSHDLGNYLTGILGFTELSLSQTTPDTPAHRFLQEVLQSAQQGAAWIRRLQSFCRRSASPAWPTRLSSVLTLEESRLRSDDSPNLRLDIQVPGDLPLLDMDAGALHLIVQELVNNAKDATKNRGTITFAARTVELKAADCRDTLGALQPGTYVELSVGDDGPGIAAEDRAKLFREIFYTTKPRGRGVGLLVVYGIILRFRGGMRLEDASQGPGTRVRLFLPIAPIEGPTQPASAKPTNVLLAHSNPLIFDSMRVILEARGCRVSAFDSPQAALGAFAAPKASFALIIVDTALQQMPGFEFARRIQDQDRDANFLFLHTQPSFHGMPEEELLEEFQLLRWPLQPPALLRAVQTALARDSS